MDLRAHLVKCDGSASRTGPETVRIAAFCHVSPYYLFMVAMGHKTPSAELAANIEYATNHKVDRRVTLPDFPWDSPSRSESRVA